MDKKITLVPGDRGLRPYGHPWIYRTQIAKVTGDAPGSVYSVYSAKGRFLGKGYFNPKSEISVRLLTEQEETIDDQFFAGRIASALAFRKRHIHDTNAFRVVFSESDRLPGLIIDRYAETVVFQIMTLGMEKFKPAIVKAITAVLKPKGIYEKSDAGSRRLEGLVEIRKWWTEGAPSQVEILENGVKFLVDLEKGHKTGFYLDQRDARCAIRGLAKGRKVFDAFTYTGGFALAAMKGGAASCLGLDVHEGHVAMAAKNAELNGFPAGAAQFESGNAFDRLKEFDEKKARFGLVVLDPPSFVKNKKAMEGALAGYKEINLRAMKILEPGGVLATFSCSQHVDDELFLQVCLDAAFDTKKHLRLLGRTTQPLDHPVDPFIPQTAYLKGLIFEVE